MEIQIENLQTKLPIDPSRIKKTVLALLTKERVQHATLNIVFVSAQKMRALNRRFKRRDYTTDVLAFDLTEDVLFGKLKQARRKVMAGDIFISTHAVVQNAKIFQSDVKTELVLYVIHGFLHLLGFDDHNPRDIKRMRAKEQDLLEEIGG